MIHQLALDIESGLQARKYPVRITYGKERLTRDCACSYEITIHRDDEAGDAVATLQGSEQNPRKQTIRRLGVVSTFYVSSPLSGAQQHEHERDCDALVDAFICEVSQWSTAAKAGTIEFAESRYLSPEEYTGGESFGGVVYRLRFEVLRGVYARDYEGLARPTGSATTVSTTSFAQVDGGTKEEI